jgi:hypothetical protein
MECAIELVIIFVMLFVLYSNRDTIPTTTLCLGGLSILMFGIARFSKAEFIGGQYNRSQYPEQRPLQYPMQQSAPVEQERMDLLTWVGVDLLKHPETLKNLDKSTQLAYNVLTNVPYSNVMPRSKKDPYYLGPESDKPIYLYSPNDQKEFVISLYKFIKKTGMNFKKCSTIAGFMLTNLNVIGIIPKYLAFEKDRSNPIVLRNYLIKQVQKIIQNCGGSFI